ncbi:MAG: Rrf2 family transcriptional regulator [Spirochaetales bacterium]|nr:Rrf2 family transcriptional regulator [Spirochaetales bacterium]
MQIGTKFSVSIHILLSVEVFREDYKVTSDFIASSVNTNPVVIRKLMSQLKKAGLIEVSRGTGGISLSRPASKMTLQDVYRAVEPQSDLFRIHKDTAPGCPVGGNIENLLSPFFQTLQASFMESLTNVTLEDLLSSLNSLKERNKDQSGSASRKKA